MRCFSLLLLGVACVSADTMPAALQELLDLAKADPAYFAKELRNSEIASVVNWSPSNHTMASEFVRAGGLPVVFGHGMGDSCFNPGMKQITADTAKHLGVYGVCIPTGNSQSADTINGFLLNMDKSVDVFAAKIRADPKLANGFNAIGFSQGNSLIRGYIQKYNDPPVNVALHVHGTVVGVAAIPQCNPAGLGGFICKAIANLAGDFAYNGLVQAHLFQADYLRVPGKETGNAYKTHSQLAAWNNEGATTNSTFKDNFLKTKKYVMVKAMGDTMVFPNEGEWWGHFKDSKMKEVVPMNQTEWYTSDLFGLKTADQAGRIHFETTPGNHLQFTEAELYGWVDQYL